MPNLLSRLRNGTGVSARSGWHQDYFTFNGQPHLLPPPGSLPGSPAEHVGDGLADRVGRVRESNGVVSAAVVARSLLVSQLRFQWWDDASGRYFTNAALAPLERPGSDSRPRLLARLEEDVSWAGNAYVRRRGNELFRLRPDWVDLLLASDESPEDVAAGADARVVGFVYHPGGRRSGNPPQRLQVGEVAHIAPEAHPLRVGLGASWITSVLRDVISDGQASEHVSNYFAHAATANMVVTAPENTTREQFAKWVEMFEDAHAGSGNAWRNLYVASGTDVQVVGSSLADLKMKELTGGFEARIAVRSRVPASVLGTREGMEGSALNAGNYTATRRIWADGWFSPYADIFCASLEQVVPPPSPFVELTYDRSRILFLQEDEKDAADISATQALAIKSLTEAGYDPLSAVDAVHHNDMTRLQHTGVFSVQLQAPGEGMPDVSV